MEINGDKHIDIISGTYSRSGQSMAGLFQVLWGTREGWKKAEPLNGTDGQPLILPRVTDDVDCICTRPFVVDYDDDGNVDIVSGNFKGTFGLFRGEGKGKFQPTATWLEGSGGPLRVDAHSDPFLVDWDKDGDLDLVSGSAQGGVFLFTNEGSRKEPKWSARTTLLEAAGHGPATGAGEEFAFGDAHCKAPAADTRVWVDDVDGDGKLDLLVGDTVTLTHVAKGVNEKDARKQLAAWQKKLQALFADQSPEGKQKLSQNYKALQKEREKFAPEERTGFVWLLRQKGTGPTTGKANGAKGTGQ